MITLSAQETNRRRFLGIAIRGLGSVMAGALAVPAALYLLYPPRVRKDSEWTEAGELDELTPNQPQELRFRRNRLDGWKVSSEKSSAWVIKTSGSNVVAFSPWCTHLGCAYHWDEEKRVFNCPCHGSVFAPDGRVLGGPATRPLDRYDVKMEDGKLWLGPVRKPEQSPASIP